MELNDTGRKSDLPLTTPTNPPTNSDVGVRGPQLRADLVHHEDTAQRRSIGISDNELGVARCLVLS